MKAWTLPSLSGIASLALSEIPDPTPAPGEVILQVAYAGLNPADRYLAQGQYPARPTFPHILGRDGVGTVIALGTGVTTHRIGDQRLVLRSEIGVNRPGTFAEKVAVPAENLVPIPQGWSPQQAAGAPLVYMTAWQALTQWDHDEHPMPKPGVVLVSGASGGVGVASVQLAHALGHRVIGLSRGPEKAAKILELGAEKVFDITERTWSKKLRDALKPAKVDLAIDNIGGELLPEMIDCLALHGRVSLVGRLAGPVPNFNTATLFFRRLRIGGVAVGSNSDAQMHAVWENVVAALGPRRPVVDSVLPFEKLPDAFARLHAGPMGKVLLQLPSSEPVAQAPVNPIYGTGSVSAR